MPVTEILFNIICVISRNFAIRRSYIICRPILKSKRMFYLKDNKVADTTNTTYNYPTKFHLKRQ